MTVEVLAGRLSGLPGGYDYPLSLSLSPPHRHSSDLNKNQLTGTLPPQWSAMTGMQTM